MSSEWTRRSSDPDGRELVFDAGSHLHLAMGARGWLLDHIDVILGTIEVPDFRGMTPLRAVSASIVPTSQLPIDGSGWS